MATFRRQPFRDFMASFQWRQGEHVLIGAPTGAGKTTLASALATRRADVVVLGCKVKDDNLPRSFRGFKRIETWPPQRAERRVLLWPRFHSTIPETERIQRIEFQKCLNDVMRTGGWCVVIDEMHYIAQFVRLDREVAILHHQGRSAGISMMVATQRPAWIPKIIYSSAAHVFIGKTGQPDDAKAFAGIGGGISKAVRDTMDGLGKHDLIYLNPMGDHEPVIINTHQ